MEPKVPEDIYKTHLEHSRELKTHTNPVFIEGDSNVQTS